MDLEISVDLSTPLVIDWPTEVQAKFNVSVDSLMPPARAASESEAGSDGDDNAAAEPGNGERPKKRKRAEAGEYDYDDPFIDDDDDDFFEQQLMYRPVTDGYFVWRGAVPSVEVEPESESESEDEDQAAAEDESGRQSPAENAVAMDEDKPPRQELENVPRVDVSNLAAPDTSATPTKKRNKRAENDGLVRKKKKKKLEPLPSLETSVGVTTDAAAAEVSVAPPVSAGPVEEGEPSKKEKVKKSLPPLPERSMLAVQTMRELSQGLDFKKGKFPVTLRDSLVSWARAAIGDMGGKWEFMSLEANKNYWTHLRDILPYQANTLKKLVDRLILPVDVRDMENALRREYRAAQEYVRTSMENTDKIFETRMARWKSEHPNAVLDEHGNLVDSSISSTSTVVVPDATTAVLPENVETTADNAAEGTTAEDGGPAPGKKGLPPVKRLLWGNDLKASIYKIASIELDLIPLKRRLLELSTAPADDDIGSSPVEQVDEVQMDSSAAIDVPSFTAGALPDPTKPELVTRKLLYQHLMANFFKPLGASSYVTTTEIGRQYNLLKSKDDQKSGAAPKKEKDVSSKTSAVSSPVAKAPAAKPKKDRKPRVSKASSFTANTTTLPVQVNNDQASSQPSSGTTTPATFGSPGAMFPHAVPFSYPVLPPDFHVQTTQMVMPRPPFQLESNPLPPLFSPSFVAPSPYRLPQNIPPRSPQ